MTATQQSLEVKLPHTILRIFWLGLAYLAALALLAACSDLSTSTIPSDPMATPTNTPTPTPFNTPTPQPTAKTKERAAPAATDAEIADLVRGNSTFAFDLYQGLRGEDGNVQRL